MDSEYQSDSEPNNDNPDEFKPSFKKLTKNQQIYGDFEYAYEPEPVHSIFSRKNNAYEQFKPGATIETYSSQVEVDLPISKPKRKVYEEEEDDKPMLGKFTLNSFLNSLAANDGLRQIVEQDEDSSQNLPEGLNEKITAHLKLVKFGEEEEQEEDVKRLEDMDLQSYLKTSRPKVPKVEPKYKTQEEKDLAKDFNQNYGVGFKMLEKMGFKVTKGLGKEEAGIQRPVEAVMKTAFTMKDEGPKKKEKKEQSQSEKDEEETKELSIPEKLFQYRSKDRKINNFLLDIQNTYQNLKRQIESCEKVIQSFQKQEDLNMSLSCQSQNQINELEKEINKLQDLENSIYNCENHPHLGLHYKLDLLYVRELYDQLNAADLDALSREGKTRIDRLLTVLNKFYLAKAKETLRDYYDQSTPIDSKLHRFIPKTKKKKEEDVIDLDNINQAHQEPTTIAFQDEEKIRQFLQVLISKCILPKVAQVVERFTGIERVTDLRVINVLETVKAYDTRGTIFKDFIITKIIPKCKHYLQTVSLDDLQVGNAKTPSQVIFPWLNVIRTEDLNILGFFRRIASKLWSMENSVLFTIIEPWAKLATPKELSFLQNFYLAPRLLHEMQQFSISQPKPSLLNGFSQYCSLLTFQLREEILENSLLLQVLEAYRQYKEKMEEKELAKWLAKWKKYTDKLAPGFFKGFFQEYAITVQ